MGIQRWHLNGMDDWEKREDGEWVEFADLERAMTSQWFKAQCVMMDAIALAIADGHRGNGNAADDLCCQVCQEIQCDDDCPVNVARLAVSAALDAARNAIDAMPGEADCTAVEMWNDGATRLRRHIDQGRVLAAIDALREK